MTLLSIATRTKYSIIIKYAEHLNTHGTLKLFIQSHDVTEITKQYGQIQTNSTYMPNVHNAVIELFTI